MSGKYSIGIILDNSLGLNKLIAINNKFSSLNSFVQVNNEKITISYTDTEGLIIGSEQVDYTYYTLAGITPEIEIEVFIAIDKDVAKFTQNVFKSIDEGGRLIPNSRFLWLDDGVNYSQNIMADRLLAWMKEIGKTEKAWIVDINTDLTGNLLSKFESI